MQAETHLKSPGWAKAGSPIRHVFYNLVQLRIQLMRATLEDDADEKHPMDHSGVIS